MQSAMDTDVPGTRHAVANDRVALMRRVAVTLMLAGAAYLVGYAELAMTPAARPLGLWSAATLAAGGVVLALLPARLAYGTVGGFVAIGMISLLLTQHDPTGTVPLFYLWPIVALAYFHRWEVMALGVAWIGVSLAPVLLTSGDPEAITLYLGTLTTAALLGTLVSVMYHQQAGLHRRLELASQLDPLTGVLNRRAFAAAVPARLARAARANEEVSMVLLDVDNFKRFNDTHGHLAGDEALRQLGAILLRQARRGDLVSRHGGEEFAVVLAGAAPWGALRFIDRVSRALAAAPVAAELRCTASWGVAAAGSPPADVDTLLARADEALYAAKLGGRNRAALWQPSGPDVQAELGLAPSEPAPGEPTVDGRLRRRSDLAGGAPAQVPDPTGAAATMAAIKAGGGQPERPQRDPAQVIRAITATMFAGGAINSLAGSLLLASARDATTQRWQLTLAAVTLAAAVACAARPGSPRTAKLATLGAAAILAVAVATINPLGSTALFFVGPVAIGAYFCSRRYAAALVAWGAASLAVALTLAPAAIVKPLTFTGIVLNTALLAGVIATMRWHEARLEHRLAELADLDPLTGLLNRRALPQRLAALRDAGQPSLAVVVIDADHFKRFNDTHGHLAGDEALRTIASQLRAATAGQADLVARFGGEEFVVALPGATLDDAQAYTARVADGLAAATGRGAGLPRVTVSGGIALGRLDDPLPSLLARADAALYAAKDAGRACTASPAPDGGWSLGALVRAA